MCSSPDKRKLTATSELAEELGLSVAEQSGECKPERQFTYSDYLNMPEDGYQYEVLGGMLIQEPAPSPRHQRASRRLQCLLEDYFWIRDPDNAPIDLTLSEIDVIQPDLVYVPGDSDIIEEKRLNGIPQLLVEIISPAVEDEIAFGNFGFSERQVYPTIGL